MIEKFKTEKISSDLDEKLQNYNENCDKTK